MIDAFDHDMAQLDRIAELERENDLLVMRLNAEHLVRQNLATESARLRELVRHLYECTRHNVCTMCDYADDACDFEYDMRELGVEV